MFLTELLISSERSLAMGNSLMGVIVNAALPTVEKFVSSGKIDAILKELKKSFSDRVPDGCSIEILITTEEDGFEYFNVVSLMSPESRITSVLYQKKLSEALIEILKESKKCQ